VGEEGERLVTAWVAEREVQLATLYDCRCVGTKTAAALTPVEHEPQCPMSGVHHRAWSASTVTAPSPTPGQEKLPGGTGLAAMIRENAVTIEEFAGSRSQLIGLVVYLLELAERRGGERTRENRAEVAKLNTPESPDSCEEQR
jgi:hypothetical protein